MPIPIAVWVAAVVIGTVAGGAGGKVYQGSKDKEELARNQDYINKLQRDLSESRKREHELQKQIEGLLKEKKELIVKNDDLVRQLELQEQQITEISLKLSKNTKRWKLIIAKITSRIKQLEEENKTLKELLDTTISEKENNEELMSSNKNRIIYIENTKREFFCLNSSLEGFYSIVRIMVILKVVCILFKPFKGVYFIKGRALLEDIYYCVSFV